MPKVVGLKEEIVSVAKAKTFLEWLLDRGESDNDPVCYYARAIRDDFSSGKKFNLLNTAMLSRVDEQEINNYAEYCVANNIHPSFANLLLLGNTMAVIEYNVGLLTGLIPCPDLDDAEADRLKQIISDCCDILPAILQDISSDMRAG